MGKDAGVGFLLFVLALAVVAALVLLREPIAELRRRRRVRAQERKRAWRREREEQKARRAVERAMAALGG